MSNLTMTEAIENLQNDDVSIRKEAIESLIGVTDEAAIDPLIEATTDENAQVRFKAAEILGNIGNVAFDRLVSKFESETGKNKRFLAFALKETNNEKAIPLFAQAVSDEDFGVRKVSIRALGELQAHDELDTIDKDFKKSCNKAIKKAEKNQKAKAEGKVVSNTIPMKTIKEMEKTNPQKAIKEYKKYVQSESDKDAPYKRLAILYRKLRQDENEIAVLEKAIEVLSVKKPGKEDWFVKRLAKMK